MKIIQFFEEINTDYFWKEQFQVLGIVAHHFSLLFTQEKNMDFTDKANSLAKKICDRIKLEFPDALEPKTQIDLIKIIIKLICNFAKFLFYI